MADMKNELTLLARAKINLSLSVLGRRADGYHELDMLTQSIELADTLIFRESDEISLRLIMDESFSPIDGETIPNDERNIALKAAHLVRAAYGVSRSVEITLVKRIPSGAGLGGGSADAATVLLGLNRFWELTLPFDALLKMAATLGADVPFCLRGGLLRVRGIGERLTAVDGAPSFPVVIVKPDAGLSTASVYAAYDRLDPKPANPSIELAIKALECGWNAKAVLDELAVGAVSKELDGKIVSYPTEALPKKTIEAFTETLGNALQPPAVSLLPEIDECVSALNALGASNARMTGSGSAVFGIFAEEKAARNAYERCSKRWRQSFLTRTVQSGVAE